MNLNEFGIDEVKILCWDMNIFVFLHLISQMELLDFVLNLISKPGISGR